MHSDLRSLTDSLAGQRILVLGDFMLDEFVFGEISRISREAPVLILKHQETTLHGGGAANAVANLASLGVTAVAVGFVGQDTEGDQLLELWPDGVDAGAVFRHPGWSTTRKTRILAGSAHSYRQQVVRMDTESKLELNSGDEKKLAEALSRQIPECNAVILSDYSLGNLTTYLRHVAIGLGRDAGIPVVVDSRDDPGGYPGATSVTPNISEVEAVLKQSSRNEDSWLEAACPPLLARWDLQSLLVTRGRLGMSLVEPGGVLHMPPFGAAEAVDVTGAGDTVAAVYSSALAAGAGFRDAARLANVAGGLVVMKKGTATVSPEELVAALETAAR